MAQSAPLDGHRIAALAALTVLGVYLCYRLAEPFLPAAAWAVALAVIGMPLHRWVGRKISNASVAAALSTLLVILVIVIPVVLVMVQIAIETQSVMKYIQDHLAGGGWRDFAARIPYAGESLRDVDVGQINGHLKSVGERAMTNSPSVISGVADFLLQSLVAAFILFFSFRDRHHLLERVRSLLPLDEAGSQRVLTRVDDAVHATVYGTLLTASVQGIIGGLLFWALGLPAPVLWGAVMVVLGIIPFLGAFIVWVPAAGYLISTDRWPAALILTTWGIVMAGPVCNYLYAACARDRLKLHAIPMLIAFIGGLVVFGVSGMVLGPCTLAVTIALLDVWRHRQTSGAIPVTIENTTQSGTGTA